MLENCPWALLASPPDTLLWSPEAMLLSPPVTEDQTPVAVLTCPAAKLHPPRATFEAPNRRRVRTGRLVVGPGDQVTVARPAVIGPDDQIV